MIIRYLCEYCGNLIGELEMEAIDEERLGFHCLTEDERKDIIKIHEETNTMLVTSLCDGCIQILGLDEEKLYTKGPTLLN